MSSFSKTLHILNAFIGDVQEYSLTELMEKTGYNKSTLHRRLNELVDVKLLQCDPITKRFHIGELVYVLSEQKDKVYFTHIIKEHSDLLCEEVQQTIHTTMYISGILTVGHVAYSQNRIRTIVDQTELPPESTGSGFLHLAYLSPQKAQRLLPLPYTDFVNTQISICKKQGFYVNKGIFDKDAMSISVPIFDRNSRIIASVSIVCPLALCTDAMQQSYIKSIFKTANNIMQKINGKAPKSYPNAPHDTILQSPHNNTTNNDKGK